MGTPKHPELDEAIRILEEIAVRGRPADWKSILGTLRRTLFAINVLATAETLHLETMVDPDTDTAPLEQKIADLLDQCKREMREEEDQRKREMREEEGA